MGKKILTLFLIALMATGMILSLAPGTGVSGGGGGTISGTYTGTFTVNGKTVNNVPAGITGTTGSTTSYNDGVGGDYAGASITQHVYTQDAHATGTNAYLASILKIQNRDRGTYIYQWPFWNSVDIGSGTINIIDGSPSLPGNFYQNATTFNVGASGDIKDISLYWAGAADQSGAGGWTCDEFQGFELDDQIPAADGWGGGATITNGWGVRIKDLPAAGANISNWRAATFGGDVGVKKDNYVYWWNLDDDTVATRYAGIRYNTATSSIDFDIAGTTRLSVSATGAATTVSDGSRGINITDNTSNPSAPASGHNILHTIGGFLRLLHPTGTATPGDAVLTGTGSNNYSHVMAGDKDSASTDTGTEVCALAGMTCVNSISWGATTGMMVPIACGTTIGANDSNSNGQYGVMCK